MARLQYKDLMATAPGTPAGIYLRRFWHPVHISANIDKGQAKPVKVLHEAFTLFRGETGKTYLVASRCPHRGVQLSAGWIEGEAVRCMYHGWKFSGDGQCVEQPAEPSSYKENMRIRSYPTQEYLGLIFAWLGNGEPPPLPRYSWFEEDGVLETNSYFRSSNYFYTLDNHSDDVHVIFAHHNTEFTRAGLSLVPTIEAEETEYGMKVVSRFSNGKSRESQLVMPTLLMFKSSPTKGTNQFSDRCAFRVPVDDNSHLTFSVNLLHVQGEAAELYREAQAELRKKLKMLEPAEIIARQILSGQQSLHDEDVQARPDLVNIQDGVAQLSQPTFEEHDPSLEQLGRSDRGVMLFRNIWLRELQALEDGVPPKQWRAPEALSITTGTDG